MGRRSRQRARGQEGASPAPLTAPVGEFADSDGGVLALRGSLSPASRREYGAVLAGGLNREDAWQRAIEYLFERLAVSWTIAGVGIDSQRELLARYRVASEPERRFVRESLRAHLAEHFPELEAP